MDDNKILVSIKCAVYNHEPYLRQCLEGFVMQKTNFRFEAIVHDDASTDGSAAIIREYADKYPEIIKPIYETENQYSKHDGTLSMIIDSACKGKYIAMCEGDDYWIDPLKLQKQVDFMEEHLDYTLSCHRYKIYDEQTKEMILASNKYFEKFNDNTEFTFDLKYAFNRAWITKTLTCVYRKNALDPSVSEKYKYYRDVHMVYYLLSEGKGVCHSFVGGVFRKNQYSTYNSLQRIDQIKTSYDVYNEFYEAKHYPIIRNVLSSLYLEEMKVCKKIKMPGKKYEWYALFMLPFKIVKHLIKYIKTFYNPT